MLSLTLYKSLTLSFVVISVVIAIENDVTLKKDSLLNEKYFFRVTSLRPVVKAPIVKKNMFVVVHGKC